MQTLDDPAAFKKLDPSGVLESTGMFADQCRQAWQEAGAIVYPEEYKKVKNIVVCGMGGSRFTPRTIKELFKDRITLPYEINEDYTLPAYVNADTLVLLSSFSGTTEEVLACAKSAKEKGAKLSGLMVDGKGSITAYLKEQGGPAYFFNPKYNPCGQPRIGGGYLLMGHAGLLRALGVLSLEEQEVQEAIDWAQKVASTMKADIPATSNPAKLLAKTLLDTHPFLVTSEFLRGFGNGFANQINETAKLVSDPRHIPELNHHFMEGLKRPDSLHQNGLFVFLRSQLYSQVTDKRFTITKEVVAKQGLKTHEITLSGPTKLAQVLEAFTVSGFTTFYMAMLYDTDPVAIPWVDYFKAELAKS